jgi:hypothetical protein
MKHFRVGGTNLCLAAGLALGLAFWAPGAVEAEEPLLILGLAGGGYVSSTEGSPPARFPEARVSALSSWRAVLAGGGVVSLNAASRLYGYWDAGAIFHDKENFVLEALLPAGSYTVLLAAGLDGSALGTVEEAPHVQPDWRFGLRTPGELWRAELQLRGHYLYEPQEAEDVLYQAARFSLTYDPSIRWGLVSALEAGWEYWPEYPAVDALPAQGLLARAEAGLEGLLGYFLDWSLRSYGGLHLSNAKGSPESESSWFLAGEGELSWSPHRQVSLHLGGFVRYDSWLRRQALSAGGAPSGETLYAFSLGLDGRADWTPNGRLFLLVEGSAARRLANDPAEERWSLSAELGVEYSF